MALLAEATAAALAPMELEAQLRARVVDELELAAHRVLLPQIRFTTDVQREHQELVLEVVLVSAGSPFDPE